MPAPSRLRRIAGFVGWSLAVITVVPIVLFLAVGIAVNVRESRAARRRRLDAYAADYDLRFRSLGLRVSSRLLLNRKRARVEVVLAVLEVLSGGEEQLVAEQLRVPPETVSRWVEHAQRHVAAGQEVVTRIRRG